MQHRSAVVAVPDLLIEQPADDGDAQEAKGGHDIGDAGVGVPWRVALVLQLQPRRTQIELRTPHQPQGCSGTPGCGSARVL